MQNPNLDRALLVDLYELTMVAAYFEHHLESRATFELFVRQLPPQRSYLVAAGIDAALDYLENLHFSEEDVRFLRGLPVDLVTDAIKPITEEGDRQAIEEMVAAGVRLVTVAEVCRPA